MMGLAKMPALSRSGPTSNGKLRDLSEPRSGLKSKWSRADAAAVNPALYEFVESGLCWPTFSPTMTAM
jgi:hypothetical protein